jgi:hypothetical protein
VTVGVLRFVSNALYHEFIQISLCHGIEWDSYLQLCDLGLAWKAGSLRGTFV